MTDWANPIQNLSNRNFSISSIGSIIVILGLPSIIAEAGFLLSTLYMGWISGREEPKWIMLMSSIPFLFLTHALPIYFVLGFAGYALVQDGNYG